jgi:hypothetical protein
MGVTTTLINKPFNPRAQDQSPKGYNRAALYSGKALDFDGVNDKVNITTDSFDLYAVSFYFKGAIGTATNGTAFSSGTISVNDGVTIGGFTASLTNETIAIGKDGNYTATNETFADGVHFICASWDATNSKYKIYVNGQEVDTFNNGSDAALNTGITAPALGYRKLLSDQYIDGGLSNVRAFNTALTAAQVADLYNNPEKVVPTGLESNLKLWLPMMEGAGTTAYDGSGNGNHGTISGATYVNGIGAPVAQSAVIDWNKGANLQPQSERLDNSAWTQQAATITANNTTAPDGTENADELIVNTSTAFHQLAAVQSVSGGTTYAFSVYAKQGSGTKYFQIAGAGLQAASQAPVFDLQNGVVYAAVTKTVCLSADIESVGDGWYRCSLIVAATGSAGMTLCFVGATNAFSGDSFAGNGTDSFYFWGAQVEAADSLGAYIPNHTATQITSEVLLPQGLTTGRDITGVNLFENVRKQGALNLDENSRASVHENASIDISDCSLEAWVCLLPSSSSGWKTIFSKVSQANLQIYLDGNDKLGHYNSTSAGGVLYNTAFNENEWNHFICVEDGSDVRTYVNGVLQSTKTISLQMDSDGDFSIGSKPNILADEIAAQIAQPRIYNRALTAEEVQRNYNAGKNTYTN